jgi:hypothetical protein
MTSFADDDVMEYRSPLDTRVPHAEIEALGRESLSIVSISEQTGVSRISIELVLAKAGVKPNDTLLARPPTAPPRFDHAAAVTAVRAGQSADTVARAMGVTPTAVRYAVKRAGPAEGTL